MPPSKHFPPPPGVRSPPLSYATRVGDLLFVSGMPGFDDKGELPDGFEAQFGFVVSNMKRVLDEAGATFRDLLHTLSAMPFGKRGPAPEPLTPQQHHRQMLGLPFGRRLSVPEIQQAYKRAAKKSHPDGGGSARDFVNLSAARDALIKEK